MAESAIQRTASLQELADRFQSHRENPFYVFSENPILEVRQLCLKAMEGRDPDEIETQLMERDLERLIAQEDPLWPDYLSYYAWSARDWKRALTFVIGKCNRPNLRSKLVHSRVKPQWRYQPEMYDFLQRFLREEVEEFLDSVRADGWYSEERWRRLTRALSLATEHGDRPILTLLRLILSWFSSSECNGPSFPGGGAQEKQFLLVQHRAYLREAVRMLERHEAQARVDAGEEI